MHPEFGDCGRSETEHRQSAKAGAAKYLEQYIEALADSTEALCAQAEWRDGGTAADPSPGCPTPSNMGGRTRVLTLLVSVYPFASDGAAAANPRYHGHCLPPSTL